MNLVNAIAVVLPMYFLSLIAAVIASWRVMKRVNVLARRGDESVVNFSLSPWMRYSFVALFLYYLINFIAESTAWLCVWKLGPNYAVYTFNYALNIPAFFLFFAIHVGRKSYSLLLVLIYGCFVCLFIDHKMWDNTTPIPFIFGVLVFSGMAVASTIFLASSLISHSRQPNLFKIHLAVVVLVYNFLALFIAVFMLDQRINGIDPLVMYYINFAIAFLFYMSSAIVIFRFSKKLRHAR